MTGYNREKELQSIDRSELDVPDFRGNTALMWAIRRGDCNMASILIKAGSDVGKRNHRGLSPLLFAAGERSCLSCMQTLLAAGAEPTQNDNSCQGHRMAVQLDKRGLLAYWHDLKATSALAFSENSS